MAVERDVPAAQSALMVCICSGTSAPLPSPLIIKNTFICFNDDLPSPSVLCRYNSCPACFVPEQYSNEEEEWATASTDDEESQGPADENSRLLQIRADEVIMEVPLNKLESPGQEDDTSDVTSRPSRQPVWADLSSNEEEPAKASLPSPLIVKNTFIGLPAPTALSRFKSCPASLVPEPFSDEEEERAIGSTDDEECEVEETPLKEVQEQPQHDDDERNQAGHDEHAETSNTCSHPLWADFSSDEEDPVKAATKLWDEKKAPGAQGRKRPSFQKASRESRTRQVQNRMAEFCSLDFQEVDASQQMGLTRRMFVLAKALADPVTFWEDEEQHKEQPFRLLGFGDADMLIVKGVTDEASQLIESQFYRQAFNKLCGLRPWFQADDGDLEAQRHRLRQVPTAEEFGDADLEGVGGSESEHAAVEDADCDGKLEESAVVGSWVTVSRSAHGNLSAQAPLAVSSERRWADVASTAKSAGTKASVALSASVVTDGQGKHVKGKGKGNRSVKVELVSDCKEAGKSDAKSKGKGKGQSKSKAAETVQENLQTQQRPWASSRPFGGKLLCFFRVGIEEDSSFKVCRRLIGNGGEHMKHVVAEAGNGVKLRLRGRGSKFLEGQAQEEAEEPLMLCISAEDQKSFEIAATLTEDLLTQIHEDYRVFCQSRRLLIPELHVRREAGRGSA